MYYIKDEEAAKRPFYTWENYQYDKTHNPGKKETFAMVYWKTVEESLLNHEITVPAEYGFTVTDSYGPQMVFFNAMKNRMESIFYETKGKIEDQVQLYLQKQDYTIDQWPDPCLPVVFRTKDPHNFLGDPPENKYGYAKGLMFNEADSDGFVFHYFGTKHKEKGFSNKSGLTVADMDFTVYLPDQLKNPQVGEYKGPDFDRNIEKFGIEFPEVKEYEKELKAANKKIDSLFTNVYKREEYEAARKDLGRGKRETSEEADAIAWTGFIPKMRWMILFILGILVLGILAVSLWLHLSGNLMDDTLLPAYEKLTGIRQYVVGLYFAFLYGICGVLEALPGKVYWIAEGILFLAAAIYMAVICSLPGCMLGEKYRRYKKIRKQYEQKVKTAEKETKGTAQQFEKGAEIIKLSKPYLEAVAQKEEVERKLEAAKKIQKEMRKSYPQIAQSWHKRWLEAYLETSPRVPGKKERAGFQVVYIKPVPAEKD